MGRMGLQTNNATSALRGGVVLIQFGVAERRLDRIALMHGSSLQDNTQCDDG
jgi:hypothetical protein